MSSRRNDRDANAMFGMDDDDNYSQSSNQSDASSLDLEESNQQLPLNPLDSAIEDLESRIISALDQFKLHPGVKSESNPNQDSDAASSDHVTIHSELKEVLRPVLEIAAHIGPATARTHWRSAFRPSLDSAIDEIHTKLNSDLIFPVLLESVQSDAIPAKRAAALSFFHNLHMEYKNPASYLDFNLVLEGRNRNAAGNMNIAGTTGRYLGTLYGSYEKTKHAPPTPTILKQRMVQKAHRMALLLRFWIEGATACTVPGAFSDVQADGAIASRAVIASSAVIRPALRAVAEKISSADDTGALKLFIPVMRMMGGVLKRLFASMNPNAEKGEVKSQEALKSACVKFLEIVVLVFSSRVQPGANALAIRRRQNASTEDFALEDLPQGHPIITRQALEEIGEDAFIVLRGLTMIGGQVKVESGTISDVRLSLGLDVSGQGTTPSSQIVGILRPAALSFLEIESVLGQQVTKETPFPILDRSNIETDFNLNQKSYALAINAVSMLATNRPTFFGDSATCLARRVVDSPTLESSTLSKAATISVKSHLRASCLTLLRNALSVTSGASDILHQALCSDICGMKIQADKALRMAKQAASLKTAGRAARNRAAVFYQWEGGAAPSEAGSMSIGAIGSKRKRAGEDKLEQMRAAKAARGLGNGIQLPKYMPDAIALIMLNLGNIPSSRAAATLGDKKSKAQNEKRSRPFTFDYFVDVIMTNGDSLASDENRWYGRDGGDAWVMDISALVSDDEAESDDELINEKPPEKKKSSIPVSFTLDTKTAIAAKAAKTGEANDDAKMFQQQCQVAAADAFERILKRSRNVKDKTVADFGNQIAAKMAWSLRSVKPMRGLKDASDAASEGISTIAKRESQDQASAENVKSFAKNFPLVSSCIQFDIETNAQASDSVANESNTMRPSSSLTQRILNEAFLLQDESKSSSINSDKLYDNTLDLYIATVLQACEKADEKPMDNTRKKIANFAASSLSKELSLLPSINEHSLELASLLCDIDGITKKAIEASRKASNKTVATAAATNAAKAAAEKRAKAALLVLRDAAFQRSKNDIRKNAVNCAVGIASGRLPASQSVEEMALKLVMNVLYPKAPDLADQVVASAIRELDRAAKYAIDNNDKIKQANNDVMAKKPDQNVNPLLPLSDLEKSALEYVKKPANLFMALCIRRPEIIKDLMSSCKEGAEVLAKAIRGNMPKLARAASKKYGAAKIATQVAELADDSETGLLMSFLDNLVPTTGAAPAQELINACIKIQEARLIDGKKDPRFIIPVLSGMKRTELESRFPSLVLAENNVFKASLHRMSEKLKKQALSFREEVDEEPLLGMSLCEQLVYLHRLDFSAAKIPQKRYLEVIRLCLDYDEVYTDRVIMAALDHISNVALSEKSQNLPLAYMRTVILTCSKHETLHSWICHVLLPRLVQCQIYNNGRQWEGWMRCARMLENGDGGVSSTEAINQLPEEQYNIYRNKYP